VEKNGTMISKMLIAAFGALASACLAYGYTETAAACRSNEGDANSVEAVLRQLKQTTEKLQSYQGQVEYLFSQPLLESKTLQKGVLYYAKYGNKSKLRINLETLKQDDEKEQKYAEHFIFDGVWLTRLDYQIKSVERHQLAEPNEPVDAFELASRNLPIIGFTKVEELQNHFEITLVEAKDEKREAVPSAEKDTAEFVHLHFRTRPDSTYKDDYTSIDLWIDRNLGLPAKVVAVSTEDDVYEIKLLKPAVNKEIDRKTFEFEIPKGFGEPRVVPLPKESKER